MNEKIKCPHCGEITNGLNRICSSCGNVLVLSSKNDSTELEVMITDIQNELVQLKGANTSSLTNIFFKEKLNITLHVLSLLAVIYLFKYAKWAPGFYILAFIAVIGLNVIIHLNKEYFKSNKLIYFKDIQARVEQKIVSAKLKFADNNRLKVIIDEFNSDIEHYNTILKKRRIIEAVIFSIIALILLTLLFLPSDFFEPNSYQKMMRRSMGF